MEHCHLLPLHDITDARAAEHAQSSWIPPVGKTVTVPGRTHAAASPHRLTALVHTADDGLLLRVTTLLHRRGVAVTELAWHIRPNVAEEGELAGDLTVVFAATQEQARVILAGFVHMVGLVRASVREERPR